MDFNNMNGVYSWILLAALICRIVKCDKLDGYSFPVYTTTLCPRNQSEWRNRSSDLNCTESNGYMCIPNENITQLLEFCYRYPRIPIEKDICLILKKSTSLVEAYSCKHFVYGCPDKQYWSNEIFEYPSCISIGNRCFLAEPLCKNERIANIGPSETEVTQDTTNVYLGSTILNTSLGNTPIPDIDESNTWVWILVTGVFLIIVFILVCVRIFIFRRENQETVSGVCIYLDDYEIWKTEISEKYKELSKEERAVLFLILCSNKNTFILEKTETLTKRESEIIGALDISKNISYSIQTLQSKGFISIENEKVTFASAGVQDETMFDYVQTSWKKSKVYRQEESMFKDNNREKFSQYVGFMKTQLLNVSLESSVKYFRSQNYRKGKFVRCLQKSSLSLGIKSYQEILTRIISKLGKDLLIHDILDDKSLHSTISSQLKIPEEVLQWDLDARSRYLEYLNKGKTPIYRSRAMIVGCAGAGKTTLLERLQGKSLEDIQKIKSTVGLDVHNDIFEVQEKEGKLEVALRKCEPAIHIQENVPIDDAEKVEEKRLLSILDFGGQCMYYACHQIYLSKRAFYILVVDMSKNLEDVIDEELCDQKDTMFSKWSHRDYLLFWLKSVDCYCGSDAPVILVATHAEEKSEQEKMEYYQELIQTFPVSSTIKTHLSSDRYFTVGLKKHNGPCIKSLDELEKRIVEVVRSQKQWGEEIPLDWAIFEKFISEKKGTKLQKLDKLKESFDKWLHLSTQEFKDLLRFYHDIGVILYFSSEASERNSPEIVILDIQWFVNSFKYVLTDSKQASFNKVIDAAPTREALDTFTTIGEISGTFLKAIWNVTKNQTAVEYKDDMMKYMERLGLMAIEEKSDICFIPSMNRMKVPPHVKSKIHSRLKKSPTLYIRFPVLPVFLFYRLIVLCLKSQWEPLMDGRKCIYIDTAMFYFQEHVLVLGVSESYIQLMLYNDDDQTQEISIDIAFSKVKRDVMKILSSLTKKFNSDLHYQVGYSCTPTEFGKELDMTFMTENDLFRYNGKKCPLHTHAEDHDVKALIIFLEEERKRWELEESKRIEDEKTRETDEKIRELVELKRIRGKQKIDTRVNAMPTSIGPTYPFSKGAIQREVMASEIKVEVSRSIGLIYIDGHPSGTGFRVGNDLIITCLHVIQGAFSARPHFIDSIRVYIQFERKQHLQNINPRKIFKFKASVKFTHQEFDFAVLELSRHELPDVHFPPPLTSFCQMLIPSEVHLIGHPGGVQMMEDSEVFPRVIEQNNDVDTYISELSNWSVQYFPDRLDHYAELRLPPRKILFHTTFDKGSSGSPGVIIKNHKPCVVLMVRGGAPGCFYEKKFPGLSVEDHKRVEYGYAMEDIYKEMLCSTNQNIRQLSSEIFREWF